jgi:rhodanese-related sulfurtransferase
MRLAAVLAAAALALSLASCGASDQAAPEPGARSGAASEQTAGEYRKIAPEEAQAMMGGDVVILDVRGQDEFDGGHIGGAVLLPVGEIKDKAESLLPDKSRTILVYCGSGARSKAASEELVGMGYTEVYDFGGLRDWPGEVVTD